MFLSKTVIFVCLLIEWPHLCCFDAHSDELTKCRCDVAVSDVWVRKIESASKHYLETERKKRERAHHGESFVFFLQMSQLLMCFGDSGVSECPLTLFSHLSLTLLTHSCYAILDTLPEPEFVDVT